MYVYAKEGFGDYMGFSSAWGYWISAWLGKIGYFVLLFGTLGFFVRVFGEGNMPVAIVCASVLLFFLGNSLLILRGGAASYVNLVTTVAKMVPLCLFIVICAISFNFNTSPGTFGGLRTPSSAVCRARFAT
jgi:arginine:ornithine antiporter / lysine permease